MLLKSEIMKNRIEVIRLEKKKEVIKDKVKYLSFFIYTQC
jgi:hypothetical protein